MTALLNIMKPAKPKQKHIAIGNRDVIAKGLSTGFWNDLYHHALTISWPMFVGITAFIFIAVNAVFAIAYAVQPDSIANTGGAEFFNFFSFSIETLASVGYGDMHPQTPYGHIIAAIEIFVGIFSIALLTGVIFARFSRPRARLLFAERPVVSVHDGKRSLVIRVANARLNMISDANAKLWLVSLVMSREGRSFRRFAELTLTKTENPTFVLSWSIFHVIDNTSPLFGLTEDDFKMQEAVLILSINGNDETTGQTIRSRHRYDHEDIAFDHRYVDILETADDGRTTINYALFHHIESAGM